MTTLTGITVNLTTGEVIEQPLTAEQLEELQNRTVPLNEQALAIRAEIKRREDEENMPKATRVFMLQFLESQFTIEQLSLNPLYTKIKTFHDEMGVLYQRASDLENQIANS